MSRLNTSSSFITPVKSDGTTPSRGTDATFNNSRGVFTLEANTTYYYPLGGQDAPCVSSHFQWDASIIITSLTVEDCDFPPEAVSNYAASTTGGWIDEDPSTAFVGTKGAGVTVTNGVVAVAGGAAGGCRFNIDGTAARRTRIAVAVGGTGGEVRASSWAKE